MKLSENTIKATLKVLSERNQVEEEVTEEEVTEEESVDEIRYDPGMSFAEKVRKRLGMVTKADRQKAKERQDARIAKNYGPTPASAKTNSKFKDHGGDMAKKIASKPRRSLADVEKGIEDRQKRDRKKRKEQEQDNSWQSIIGRL